MNTPEDNLQGREEGTDERRFTGSTSSQKDDKGEPAQLFFGGNRYSNSGPLAKRHFDAEFVAEQRVHRTVLPDLERKFEAILTGRKWQRLPELGPGIPYPGIEEWVTLQISSGQGVKFYPCFIQDRQGTTRFLKVQVTQKNGRFGMETDRIIAKEARILRTGLLPVRTPAYVDHGEGGETTLAFLCVEAIGMKEGQVLPGLKWSSDACKSAAAQIRSLEDLPLQRLETLLTKEERQGVGSAANIADLLERAGSYLAADLRAEILTLVEEVALPNVFIHGDLTLNNIIVCANRGTEFVLRRATSSRRR